MSDRPTLQQAAADAITVQSACNISGVVHAFARAMYAITDDCRAKGQGSDAARGHPITLLFVDKLRSMGWNPSPMAFAAAYADCEKMAGEKVVA